MSKLNFIVYFDIFFINIKSVKINLNNRNIFFYTLVKQWYTWNRKTTATCETNAYQREKRPWLMGGWLKNLGDEFSFPYWVFGFYWELFFGK